MRSELLRRPSRLAEGPARVWDRVAVEAMKEGRLTEGSRESFAVYCEVRWLADTMEEVVYERMPAEFVDPQGNEQIVHPARVAHADLSQAALQLEQALGIGLGRVEFDRQGGKLGSLVDARFNRLDPRDIQDFLGPRLSKSDDPVEADDPPHPQ